jgi:hypothetical protein
MFRQTVVAVSTMFAVWGLGVAVLALNTDASADMNAGIADAESARYEVNTSTSSAYQDPTGRFTVYVRTALRDRPETVEVEKY